MMLPRPFNAARSCSSLFFAARLARGWAELAGHGWHALAAGVLPAMFLLRTTREEVYNILWALVFGFATLNILSLGARRFEQEKSGLNFGEFWRFWWWWCRSFCWPGRCCTFSIFCRFDLQPQ